jgi:hypothetical protein
MTTVEESGPRQHSDRVRLVYHYRDGHDFTTDAMLRSEAVGYMPLLHATRVDDEHYEAPFASIEVEPASSR